MSDTAMIHPYFMVTVTKIQSGSESIYIHLNWKPVLSVKTSGPGLLPLAQIYVWKVCPVCKSSLKQTSQVSRFRRS